MGHNSDNGIIRDYCDAAMFLKHPLLTLDSNFLQIFLYYDDLEVCNPLGSKRIIHKLGKLFIHPSDLIYSLSPPLYNIAVFYFVLGNIPPLFHSKVSRIQLATIAKSEHLKKYGANTILKPIIEDIKKLVSSHIYCSLLICS